MHFEMKFFITILFSSISVHITSAFAQTSTSASPASMVMLQPISSSTNYLSAIETCLSGCQPGQSYCRVVCLQEYNLDYLRVNSMNACARNCVQGDGTPAANQAYSDCMHDCIAFCSPLPNSGFSTIPVAYTSASETSDISTVSSMTNGAAPLRFSVGSAGAILITAPAPTPATPTVVATTTTAEATTTTAKTTTTTAETTRTSAEANTVIAVATTTTAFNGVATTTTARTDVVATIGEKYAGTIATAFSGSAASGGAASGGAAINAQMDVSVASLAGLFIAVLAF